MNYAKINMFLLIVAIIGIAAALYFLFVNQKHTNSQDDALAVILKSICGEEIPSKGQEKVKEKKEELPAKPTEEELQKIYAISEKIYFKKPLTIHDKNFQKKFDSYIEADLEYCKEFYPLVDKMAFPEKYNPLESVLSVEENEFYEANKEQVDEQVAKVKQQASKQPPENPKSPNLNSKLDGANPPLNIEERNKKILSLFEDGIPKSVPQIKPLYMTATGTDPGKNLHRIFGKLEGKFFTPYKDGRITYYCLPEWFDGRKLKSEFKNKIV